MSETCHANKCAREAHSSNSSIRASPRRATAATGCVPIRGRRLLLANPSAPWDPWRIRLGLSRAGASTDAPPPHLVTPCVPDPTFGDRSASAEAPTRS
jgi:hypothetical protein